MNTMETVSQEIFLEYLKEHFLDHMTASFLEREPSVEIKEGALYVNVIGADRVSTPKVLLNGLYDHYTKSNESLDVFVEYIARGYEERFHTVVQLEPLDMDEEQSLTVREDHVVDFPDWQDRVFLAVIGTAQNKEFLSQMPYIKKGDYAVFCQIGLGDKNMSGCYDCCITVTNKLFEAWHIEVNRLMDVAATNSQVMFPGELRSISAYGSGDHFLANRIFILSNKYHFNGAAALFYQPEILWNMSAAVGEKNFVLFPSGYNEILCLAIDRDNEWKDYQTLFDSFRNINGFDRGLGSKILLMDCEKKSIRQLDGAVYSPELFSQKRAIQMRKM